MARISGAAALFLDFKGISILVVQRLERGKPLDRLILPDTIDLKPTPTHGELLSEMGKALAVAGDEAAVAKVIQHLDPVHNAWEALYRAFEEIQKYAGEDISNWTSKAEREKFSRTANHHRHAGDKQNTLPDDPMGLQDARSFIRELE